MSAVRTPGPWSQCDINYVAGIDGRWINSGDDRHTVGHATLAVDAAFIVEACNNYERVCAERDELAKALRIFAECDLNDSNCASLEVATQRIRNTARMALAKAQP